MNSLALAWRLAQRELRSGLSGFRIFFACLVLGVAAIAGVDSIADALLAGLADHGRALLGGDIAVELVHRPMGAVERAFVTARGTISETISMRAMAYANGANAARQLIELKAVDNLYPLYGSVGLSPATNLKTSLACTQESCGAIVEQTLLDRLGLARGGRMRIGNQSFRIAAVLTDEPDRLSGGFSLGPHAIISTAALDRTGLVTTGSLINYSTRVKLPANASIAAFRREARARFPDAGWQIRDRDHAAPGTDRFIRQVSVFLTLVGLTALAVGGVGAGQAVRAFIDRKREEIATLKALGADGHLIFLIFFLQAMAIAALASLTGLLLGAAIPFIVEHVYGAELPVPASFRIFPGPLALAFVFGMLSAAAFAVPPLARAREIAPAGLFRDLVAPAQVRGRLPYLATAAGAALLILALALAVSPSRAFTLWFLAGATGGFVALRLAAAGLRVLLRTLPAASRPAPRLALANMTRPGSPTDSVIVALGLGLSLLAAVTLLDRTISAQVNDSLPESAPTFFFVDIQPADVAAFDSTIARFGSVRDYRRTPMIRGRITALNHVPAAKAKVASDSRWALSGDRGITYAAAQPKDADLASGRWWPANYRGPTLISFDAELAEGMGLKVGDSVTLNVLGREIEGRIANLRHVDFSNGRQNFILILSPGIIDKAPHSFLATVRVAPRDEDALYRAVTDRFHSVSTVRVRDVIAQLDTLLGQLAFGVRAASLVTILAGLLVLAGAVAAGQRARLYDSTVMKVVGATRSQIALVYAIEYALVGVLTGALALSAGTAAAWLVTRRVFEVHLAFDWRAVLLTVAGGALATLVFGFATSWTALAAKPAAQLRNP
ncbi:MAG TPA: FtsX-like permease family protein [Rhizomicrobium sp.]|jgi:putative ABC transport system permease protein|nr:FtsX-like permease family protein [Rhizomicrobium sp.]